MSVEHNACSLIGKHFGTYIATVDFTADKLVEQKRIFGKVFGFGAVFICDKVGIFVAESKNCRRFDADKRSFVAYDIAEHCDIGVCNLLRLAHKPLAEPSARAFLRLGKPYLVAKLCKQRHRIHGNMRIQVARKLFRLASPLFCASAS